MIVKAYPKVNLALDILGKDSKTGFHFIKTVLYEIKGDMYDKLEISKTKKGIKIICDKKEVPTGKENTVWKAVRLMQKECLCRKCLYCKNRLTENKKQNFTSRQCRHGICIKIEKNIPLGSGLGGASSDAAGVLKAMNKLWTLKLSKEQLVKIGSKIGKDVPFFIQGGTAIGSRFGEKIKKLPHRKLKIKIINTGIKVNTKEAYQNINLSDCGEEFKKTKALIVGILTNNKAEIIKNIHNDFKSLVLKNHPSLNRKSEAYLTGSGGCMFKILSSR